MIDLEIFMSAFPYSEVRFRTSSVQWDDRSAAPDNITGGRECLVSLLPAEWIGIVAIAAVKKKRPLSGLEYDGSNRSRNQIPRNTAPHGYSRRLIKRCFDEWCFFAF